MERLVAKGYLDAGSLSSPEAYGDSNHIRTACLNFARDRFDLIKCFSRMDVQIVAGSGCPSLDRKVVNSGKRLRAHVGIEEGGVCSSCNLRGNCERAYVKASDEEGGRTVDVMRFLLTFGLNHITGSVKNQACFNISIQGSARKLLHEMVEFSAKELDVSFPKARLSNLSEHRNQQGQKWKMEVPTRLGDWICPKCNFLNFARNFKCLRCNGLFEERLKMLRDTSEHLPLKKGDWICEKCNFLNFAKNTKCLQCHEKPLKCQLNPGEWECLSCNYINFQRNMVCLICVWKRPKAYNVGGIPMESQSDSTLNNPRISFIGGVQSLDREVFDSLWSASNDGGDDAISPRRFTRLGDFPVSGGSSVLSDNPVAREMWKEDMLKRSKNLHGNETDNVAGHLDSASVSGFRSGGRACGDDDGEDDEMAEWFRGGSTAKGCWK